MPVFNFTANFNAAPLGPLTKANKKLVWGNPVIDPTYSNEPNPSVLSLYDADPNGQWMSIVTGGKNGGQCQRCFYPANTPGENNKYYRLEVGTPAQPVNIEFDWLFEDGTVAGLPWSGQSGKFDWSKGPGKIGPQIYWGGRTGAAGGAAVFCTWGSATGTYTKPWNPILQNQQSPTSFPSEFISPTYYTANNLNANQWYHWRLQFMGGPIGWVRFWLDGALLPVTWSTTGNTTPADPVWFEMGFWAGGTVANAVDSYARVDNIHAWTEFPEAASYTAAST